MNGGGKFWERTGGLERQILGVGKKEKLLPGAGGGGQVVGGDSSLTTWQQLAGELGSGLVKNFEASVGSQQSHF